MNSAYLNGKRLSFEPGETIYQWASRHLGEQEIPVLCNDPALKPFGACRLCLVDVALDAGRPGRLLAACHTPVAAGQHITTSN
ncbi:MAG: hypothetical protein DSZ33_04800, partial [Gammaproteobacteria bacterium]